ncbi:OTU domain-containing protein DDB_G0284757 [Eutrema salsugineum]|uniref:OTU domain-containing protein DDB_G0284757 n=1 Tax=Eutrema salsugineum TaxID=72664 RepID=UPI000CED519A|nr:OTU domain-containing protein DDB_G0284757 [Eutrema salsugineum]
MPNTRIKSRCLEDLNDYERLQDRLEWEGYSEIKVKSDGNCKFRALADQLYKTSDCHKRVRQEIVKQLKSRPKLYKGLVGKTDEFSEYVKNMSNDSVWGDEVTLKAAADVYGVKILLITSFKDVPSIEVVPRSQKQPDRVIHLSYLAGIHFNSIHLNQASLTQRVNVNIPVSHTICR